ncbi:MAG TPA: ferrous iron transport protein B [Candidatus Aphodoplasma excrementigallinarum]|uniref:Ferrous iron transport protein B n=1 Tax=Candidatus Aphodoplasma excrementigallinarum TaxID=2840673 RepID=A0A9D1NFF2_9FIRM|nr:ferrous iron transport protein B [Candidatus Aphodoplasma excrementigallinarum]
MTFALIGNQNSGKTTLFNQLTGSNQHVGNFPGVTVEKKEGTLRKHKDVSVVDLPGIYSLSPYTAEEVVTRDFALNDKPDGIINIVDATNIERNLYLTLQLTELQIPMILALNMMDEVTANGDYIDIDKLSSSLGVPVVPISASKNDGIDELVDRAIATVKNGVLPQKTDFCQAGGELHKTIHSIAHIIEDHANAAGIPTRFAATKLVEGDTPMMQRLALHKDEVDLITILVQNMEKALGTYRDAALADMRYDFIERLCARCVEKKHTQTKQQLRSIQIDKILTHKVFALPIFLCIMLFVFWITFGLVGPVLSDLLSEGIDLVTQATDTLLINLQVSEWLRSLVIDGVFAGVGSVLSFLPTIVVLFFLLSILEDSGYMARVAFVMDKLLRKIGLSGRSFVPMLIGFGCSVPAIMATRTLSSERDRRMTVMLIPFISCSAKLPIYTVFTAAFFPKGGALVMMGLYVFGILMGILSAFLLKNTLFKGKPVPFVMELPAYRLPAAKSVLLHMWEKAKDFIVRAFTVIFFATIVIWLLQSFDLRFEMVQDSSQSILANIGKFVAPIFAPLGFGNWQAVTALITGLTAKEAVVSTFAVLTGAGDSSSLIPILSSMFTPLQALSFLVFTLLYMPCVAAMAAVKRELGGYRSALLLMLYQTAFAWVAAFVVYSFGLLFFG